MWEGIKPEKSATRIPYTLKHVWLFKLRSCLASLPFSLFTSFSFPLKHVKQMFHACIGFSKQKQNLKQCQNNEARICNLSFVSYNTWAVHFLHPLSRFILSPLFTLLSPFPFSLHFLATSLYAFSLTPQFLPLLTCLFSPHPLLLSLSTFF